MGEGLHIAGCLRGVYVWEGVGGGGVYSTSSNVNFYTGAGGRSRQLAGFLFLLGGGAWPLGQRWVAGLLKGTVS